MANLNTLINLADIAKVSKSFGIVGAAANKTPIIIVNDNQPIATQEIIINKPIVKMINVLASIDGFLKQRLENQKAIARNEILANRESNIEQKNQEPEIHVITPDAEKESGSGLGLLALGGLALLAFDPVQDAIKQIADLTVQSGQFISNAVRTINDVFNFLFSSSSDTPENPNTTGQINPASGTPSQGQDQQNQTETRGQPPSEERPAPVANTTDATPAVAATGNEVRRTTTSFSRGSTISSTPATSATPAAAPASAPVATPTSSTSSTPSATPASTTTTSAEPAATANAGGIPRGDIVALGRYLQGQGVTPSEHPAFGSVSRTHSTNSRHYRGMAMDLNVHNSREAEIFDRLEPQLRAAGYNTIWRKPGHQTHMHVSVGGPEGVGGGDYGESTASSIAGTIGSVASASLEQVAELFGILGAAIEPGSPRNNIPLSIATAARELNVNIAETRTPTPPTPPTPPVAPRINRMPGGPTQNPPTMADRNGIYYYLRRFGYQDLNSPESVIPAT